MAKKRRSFRRKAKTAVKYARRRKSKTGGNITPLIVGGFVYGGVREYMSNLLMPLTEKIPLGDLSDEIVLLGVDWALAKRKIPVIKGFKMASQIGKAGLMLESARIGSYFLGRMTAPRTTTIRTSQIR